MARQFKSLALAAACSAAASAAAFSTQDFGYLTLAGASTQSRYGVTSKLEDCGARIVQHGVTNGADTFYFTGKTPAGQDQILSIRSGDGPTPPEVAARLDIGFAPYTMAWEGGTFVAASSGKVLVAPANDLVTTATVTDVPFSTSLAIFWTEAKRRLIRHTSASLECYDATEEGALVLRGSFPASYRIVIVEPTTDAIVALAASGSGYTMLRWPDGAAQPDATPQPQNGLNGASAMLLTIPPYICNWGTVYEVMPYPQPLRHAGWTGQPTFASRYGGLELYNGGLYFSDYEGLSLPIHHSFQGSPAGIGKGMFRVAFGAPRAIMVAPEQGGDPSQAIYQVTVEPPFHPGYLNGFATRIAPYLKAGGVRLNTAAAVGNVRVAVYATTSGDVTRQPVAPMELLWESSWIPVTSTGTMTVGFPSLFEQGTGSLAAVVNCDTPGVLLEDLSREVPSPFRLYVPGGDPPQQFDWDSRLQRSGMVAMSLVGETPMTLNSVSMVGNSPLGNNYTNEQSVSAVVDGDFQRLEIAENPGFADAESYTSQGLSAAYTYTLRDTSDGPHTLYIRATAGLAQSQTAQAVINVDLTPPAKADTPRDQGDQASGYSTSFTWNRASDGDGVGVVRYQIEGTLDGKLKIQNTVNQPTLGTTVTATPSFFGYGVARLRVRAVDYFGLPGPWSEWSDGILLFSPEPPTMDYVASSATAVNQPRIGFRHTGASAAPAVVQMSEDPGFEPVQQASFVAGQEVTFNLSPDYDGIHRVYHRLKSPAGTSEAIWSDTFLDRVPPESIPPVAENHFAPNGVVNLLWRVPVDPGPSSGLGSADLEVVRDDAPTSETVFAKTFGRDVETTRTVVLDLGVRGGLFRARGRGTDGVSNVGSWAVSEPFEINARPLPPDLAYAPFTFNAGAVNGVSGSATDPDGDAIAGYHYQFQRWSVAPQFVVEGSVLPPSRVRRGEQWRLVAYATDARGGRGWEKVDYITIGNGVPSQPIVQILPRTPQPGNSVVVDVEVYSVDPDGDRVGYEFRWSKSADNGATWIRKTELTGSSVDGQYIRAGELWKVEYIPYEIPLTKTAERVEGKAAEDIIRVGGGNLAPAVTLGQPFALDGQPGQLRVRALWTARDPEGGPITIDLYLTDQGAFGVQRVATGVSGAQGLYDFTANVPPGGGPYYLYLVATDSQGNTTRAFNPTAIAPLGLTAAGWKME